MFTIDTEISMDFRPVPFWSWNDKLEPEELRWQIREMHKAGIGGFFMHARGGLKTEYLSKEWFDCVNVCLDEAGKLGMNAWLYDENGWPSGFGGGIVNAMGPYYQQKYLRFEIGDAAELQKKENTIAFYSEDGTRFLGRGATGLSGRVMRAYYLLNPYYVDNMDAKIVAEFIRVTHQRYYETIPTGLLKHLKGVFTDEPQLSRNGLLWSLVLEDEYRAAYGIDLLSELPALAYQTPGHEAVRIRFWKLCAKLFSKNFLKQIREWCDAHGWMITGHHVLEETCSSQLTSNGAIMPQYQYYSIPGIDHLGRGLPSTVMMNQLASVAAQFGHKRILTESFACTGWNCNFDGQRWIYNTQLAHGINMLCQHLEGYTLRGQRKRDYPSSAFYHQPWWKFYRTQNDSFSRIGQMLAQGTQDVDVLVLHPQSSAWTLYDGSAECCKEIDSRCTKGLSEISKLLDSLFIAHHYADEILAEEYGCVCDGKLKIGAQSYSTIILPPLLNISKKILNMLRAFATGGGELLRIGDGDILVDGLAASKADAEWLRCIQSFKDVASAAEYIAEETHSRPIVTEDGKPSKQLVGTCRKVKSNDGRDCMLYFFATLKYKEESRLHFSLPAFGTEVLHIDSVTGSLSSVKDVSVVNGRLEFDYPLAGADAAMFAIPSEEHACGIYDRALRFADKPLKTIDAPISLASHSENIITLDKCLYSVDGGEFQEADVISIHSRLLNLKRNLDLTMKFNFRTAKDFDLSKPLTLVVENPERLNITLNGKAVPNEDTGYLFDKAFRRVAIPSGLVMHGENEIVVRMRYTQPDWVFSNVEKAKKFETEYNKLAFDSEVESIYLVGDFTVRFTGTVESCDHEARRFLGDIELGAPLGCDTPIDSYDICTQGFPFFAGTGVFRTQVELSKEEASQIKILKFSPRGVNTWRLKFNGYELEPCSWGPYAYFVKYIIRPGVNTIEFEFTTSLRNMLGPHHQVEAEPYGIWTLSWSREANFAGYEAPKTQDGFCFVETGISDIYLA